MAVKYLDYEGLSHFKNKLDAQLESILGTGYNINGSTTNVKNYIDSRIFVGTEADVSLALSQGRIDESTFTMITDDNLEEVTSISNNEIIRLFDTI